MPHAVARFAGFGRLIRLRPGAYAPGFMLPPAPQARTKETFRE